MTTPKWERNFQTVESSAKCVCVEKVVAFYETPTISRHVQSIGTEPRDSQKSEEG